ncbi:MAG: globin domain-containing protein [Pseudomonadota bacterium]
MISDLSRPYIVASVPVLRAHGVAITTTFYRKLFAAHPELTNVFNMGNQANGAQQQSLAAAVFAYAANIDHPGALAPVINRIVHKHVSLGVRPEHYPIVGRHLLDAIAETLGQDASAELMSAWEEAYNALARLFIDAEQALYRRSATVPGALQAMRVLSIERQSEDILSITLAPADGSAAPSFMPGQYVSCAVTLDDGSRQLRQYSLSDAPAPDRMRISVKRETAHAGHPDGAVSNWLHQHVRPGSLLEVSHPFGEFTPDTESAQPIVLLSAGVGITPMIAVLNRIAAVCPQRQVMFAHAARSPAHHAHQADVAAAQARMPGLRVHNFYESDPQEPCMSVAQLPHWPRADAEVYLCGPLPFMHAQREALLALGVPPERLHREVFGPDALQL